MHGDALRRLTVRLVWQCNGAACLANIDIELEYGTITGNAAKAWSPWQAEVVYRICN